MHPAASLRTVLLIAFTVVVAAGCGSEGRDIGEARACLEKLGLNVDSPAKSDKDVEEGLFATSDFEQAGEGDFTFAVAAHVRNEAAVERFQQESREFSKSVSADDKLQIESGTDGSYVWVAGGSADSDAVSDARDCVEP